MEEINFVEEINLGEIPFDVDFHPSDNLVATALINGDIHLYVRSYLTIFLLFIFFSFMIINYYIEYVCVADTVLVLILSLRGINSELFDFVRLLHANY